MKTENFYYEQIKEDYAIIVSTLQELKEEKQDEARGSEKLFEEKM